MGSHPGQLPAHYGRHLGHVRHRAVSLQIPHLCESPAPVYMDKARACVCSYFHTETDLCICLAVCSMAGPLGRVELVHHLLLPGGWKPVSGKCLYLNI